MEGRRAGSTEERLTLTLFNASGAVDEEWRDFLVSVTLF
jgi:hypothetical protein